MLTYIWRKDGWISESNHSKGRRNSVVKRDVNEILQGLNVCASSPDFDKECAGCPYHGLDHCIADLCGDASIVIRALLPLAEEQAVETGKAEFPVSPVKELTGKRHKKPRVFYDRRGNYGKGEY